MPSPFPGMDPYLEAKGHWETFHAWLVPACAENLNPRLPRDYIAQPHSRIALISLDEPALQRLPDVLVGRRENGPSHRPDPGSEAIATLVAAPVRLVKHETEIAERWIEILHLPEMELVTAIEILSPTNKVGLGRSDYLRKRNALIDQPVNLVEIDLLRGGRRMPTEGQFPAGDYYAIVARSERRPDAAAYAWTLREPLPPVPIPLRAPDPDAILELAEVFRVCYDRGEYARIMRYGTPLPANFPIAPEDRSWAESVGR